MRTGRAFVFMICRLAWSRCPRASNCRLRSDRSKGAHEPCGHWRGQRRPDGVRARLRGVPSVRAGRRRQRACRRVSQLRCALGRRWQASLRAWPLRHVLVQRRALQQVWRRQHALRLAWPPWLPQVLRLARHQRMRMRPAPRSGLGSSSSISIAADGLSVALD